MAKLSAIIACYRDGPAVLPMYERLCKAALPLGLELEIIFVNDASPDDAEDVLRVLAARDPRVVVVNHTRNFGSQAAFSSGLKLCTGDMAVLMDGDLQDPPELIPALYAKYREGYEVVYGERVKREATLFLQLAYKAFYRVFRRMSYVSIPTDAGDFSLLDRKVIDALNALPERDRFLRGLPPGTRYLPAGAGPRAVPGRARCRAQRYGAALLRAAPAGLRRAVSRETQSSGSSETTSDKKDYVNSPEAGASAVPGPASPRTRAGGPAA
jgi:glycosyltransferase involved in cell wall biosynthesis